MRFSSLEQVLKNEAPYRLQQAKLALFRELIEDWSCATNLPLSLRKKLNRHFPLKIQAKIFPSPDQKTLKALITLQDGLSIECVLIHHQDGRHTVCVSSQVGCPLGCLFCATAKMGFQRNLSAWEIIIQVLLFARLLKKEKKKVTNLVFMGMGEPFLNYSSVLQAIKILHDPHGFNLGARRFSLSTVGITEGIQKLSQEKLEINLAISLHAPTNELRSQIMPINQKYPLEKIFKAVDEYLQKTRRKVMFEYVMIKGLNDSLQCAQKLVPLIKGRLAMVNLIAYNPTQVFQPSPPKRIKQFKEILKRAGLEVTQRYRFGQDIHAACGQLAPKVNLN